MSIRRRPENYIGGIKAGNWLHVRRIGEDGDTRLRIAISDGSRTAFKIEMSTGDENAELNRRLVKVMAERDEEKLRVEAAAAAIAELEKRNEAGDRVSSPNGKR